MNSTPKSDIYYGLVRHALTTIGGILVTRGVIESSWVEPVVGALLVLAGFAESIIEKRNAKTS